MKNQRVLLPVDLNVSHRALASTTRRLFDRRDVDVVILHAIEDQPRSGRGIDVDRAMAQMEFLAHREFSAARVSRRVERGRAADCILDYARSHEVDFIVMPAGGISSLRRCSLGHVSEEVLAGAPSAVWMEWMTGSVEQVRQVCCAVRFGDAGDAEAAPVLQRAAETARELGAALTLVHAISPEPRRAAELMWNAALREHEIRLARTRLEALREEYAPGAQLYVQVGDISSVVSRALYRMEAGLLVAAGQGEAVAAAQMACPVLRIARPMTSAAGAAVSVGRIA